MKYTYKTKGCCATEINFEVEDNKVKGCPGNTKGVSVLVEGMEVNDVVKKLKGVSCRTSTSCPDQFAIALEELVLNAQ